MLITQLKDKEEILYLVKDKKNVFVIQCYGCKEVHYPYDEVVEFLKANNMNSIMVDYLCRNEFAKKYIEKYNNEIAKADIVLIFTCGVGVQSFTRVLYHDSQIKPQGKEVHAGCNTLYVNGFQGLTPNLQNCKQCGTCFLNYTGGVCPITACSKSLVNGQCGGSKNGKCEVDKEMDCGWVKITEALKKCKGKELEDKVQLHDFKIIP